MAVAKKAARTRQTADAKLKSQIERYESFFREIETFVEFIDTERIELQKAKEKEASAKAAYDEARELRRSLEDSISGSKDALFRIVSPGPEKFLPLFDRMEEADPDKHGELASEWRTDPITVLRLSPVAAKALIDADIVCVGQLQDRVLADADGWWENIDGLTIAIAAAIADKLNDFIFRDGNR